MLALTTASGTLASGEYLRVYKYGPSIDGSAEKSFYPIRRECGSQNSTHGFGVQPPDDYNRQDQTASVSHTQSSTKWTLYTNHKTRLYVSTLFLTPS